LFVHDQEEKRAALQDLEAVQLKQLALADSHALTAAAVQQLQKPSQVCPAALVSFMLLSSADVCRARGLCSHDIYACHVVSVSSVAYLHRFFDQIKLVPVMYLGTKMN